MIARLARRVRYVPLRYANGAAASPTGVDPARTSAKADGYDAILLAVAAAIWCATPYIGPATASSDDHHRNDLWDDRAAGIQSLDDVQKALPSFTVDTGHRKRDVALAITDVVQRHFVHGVARQSCRTNWIATVIDYFAPDTMSFSGMMDPDELLTQNIAFCSQATLVTQALFARNGIPYATVSFNEGGRAIHSALAGAPDGVWRLYDPSMEPKVQGMAFSRVLTGDTIQALYSRSDIAGQGRRFQQLVRQGKVRLTGINGGPPRRGPAVQWLNRMLSRWGWVALLVLAAFRERRSATRRAKALQYKAGSSSRGGQPA